jgi:hypothetical protein
MANPILQIFSFTDPARYISSKCKIRDLFATFLQIRYK